MAWENQVLIIGQVQSSGDMTGNQYLAVQLSTTNDDDGVVVVASRGVQVDGVWQGNSTVATGDGLMVLGVTKMAAGDSSGMPSAINRGTPVVASSIGQAVPSTAVGQSVIGISYGTLGTASTGIIPVFLTIGKQSSS